MRWYRARPSNLDPTYVPPIYRLARWLGLHP